MTEAKPQKKAAWSFVGVSAEARRAAEDAAQLAGMDLDTWLAQIIKYQSAIELGDLDFQASQSNASKWTTGPVDALDLVGAGGSRTGGPSATHVIPIDGLQPSRMSGIETASARAIEKALGALRRSGTMEPILVRPSARWPGLYEIIAGEDRWQAARRAQLTEVPVAIHRLSDREAVVADLIDRLPSLVDSPLGEAETYRRLIDECGLAVADIGSRTNRTTEHIDTMVRLASLPRLVQDMLERGELTILHARALFKASNPEAVAQEVVRKKLDIFRTEQLIGEATRAAAAKSRGRRREPAELSRSPSRTAERPRTAAQLADYLSRRHGLKVSVDDRGAGGDISIDYDSPTQLRDLIAALCKPDTE